ncbi:hypothetical protein CC80DRAFT_462678, partial [Byssothecium circinans]
MARCATMTFRNLVLSFVVITIFFIAVFYRDAHAPARLRVVASVREGEKRPSGAKYFFEKLDLEEKDCRRLFPGIFPAINYAMDRGKFILEKSDADYTGLVQGRIHDNKLYILTTSPDHIPRILHQRTAILSQLHRALLTSPSKLPNTHFSFVTNDEPKNNTWSFSRPNKQSTYNVWPMPSFAFWAWPPQIGTFDDVLSRIDVVEASKPFEEKDDRVVWRGTPWFNSLGNPQLRQDLLRVARGREWADVEALNVSTGMPIEDFCGYKYVVYTEGITYSGRLPYHQACESVLLTAPLTHLTHTAWWMKPIFAEDLMASFVNPATPSKEPNSGKEYTIPSLLPTTKDWREANAVYTSRNFDDLEATVSFLHQQPHVARRIARNQRGLVAKYGYMSPAAETCYWRGLIRGWASRAEVDEGWVDEMGERYEMWLLREVEIREGGRRPGR